MFTLILSVVCALIAVGIFIVDPLKKFKGLLTSIAGVFAAFFFIIGSVSYNDSGKCTHVQTIFGNEDYTCSTGWYFSGWGRTTEYPHFITVANATNEDGGIFGSSISKPYPIRLSDNWNGDVTQTTRFGIPQTEKEFMKMHHDFRSPERLIQTTLKPAVTSSLDSVANLFSMEEYYAGGKRDQFKTEFKDAIEKGRAKVKQVVVDGLSLESNDPVQANNLNEDTSVSNNRAAKKIIMEKVTDEQGNVIREIHDYTKYGITVSSAILENLDPDDKFENQIQDRKLSASKRMVAQEQRKEQEEQRLLAIQIGQTEIAKKQAAAEVEQIQKTTDAETEKKLAVIKAEQMKAEANIAKETAALNLDKAKLEAQTTKTLADAEAYAKKAVIEADGALEKKLEAYVQAQSVWANAATQMKVPVNVFGGTGSTNGVSTAESLMQMLSIKTAKDLALDLKIQK